MKWFKHFSFARSDAKIEKLIMKYGIRGYGLYFYCLEIIAGDISSEKLTFELEHDAETIAHRFHDLSQQEVEDMMTWMVDMGLFQYNEATGRILGLGLVKQLDNTVAQSAQMRALVASPAFQEIAGLLPVRVLPRPVEVEPVEAEVATGDRIVFGEHKNVRMTQEERNKLIERAGLRKTDEYIERLGGWKAGKGKRTKSDYATILNWMRRDNVIKPITKEKKQTCPECGKPWDSAYCRECGHNE